jgi:hypothetical protein
LGHSPNVAQELSKTIRAANGPTDLTQSRASNFNVNNISEQLMAGFAARQASSAYQEMLVSAGKTSMMLDNEQHCV